MFNRADTSLSHIFFKPDLIRSSLDAELSQIVKIHSPTQILLTDFIAAKYLCLSKSTLAAWRSSKRHNLPFKKKGKDIHYFLSDLNTFIERHASKPLTNANLFQSLVDRKSAAKIINSTSGTLAVWVTNKNHDIACIRIGRTIRYRPYDLAVFNLERLRVRKLN